MSNKSGLPIKKFKLLFIFLLCLIKISIAQNCQSSQFAQYYSFDGYGYGPYADTIPGGGFITGNVRNYKKALIRADAEGSFLWGKQYDFSERKSYSDRGCGKVDKTGKIVIDVNGMALALLNPVGDVITMKELAVMNDNVVIHDVFILPDNKKLVFLKDHAYYGAEAYGLVCLSEDLSTILWSKYFSGYSLYLNKPEYVDNKLFFSGRLSNNGVVFCINAITGSLINQAKFNIGNDMTILQHLYKTDDGYIATAQYTSAPTYPHNHVVIRLDNNFNVIKAYGLSNIFDDQALVLIPEPDGAYYGCASGGGIRFAVSATDQILYSRITTVGYLYTPFTFFKYRGGLLSVACGNWYNVGANYESSIAIIKSDENGSYACFSGPSPRSTNIVNVIKSPWSLYYRDSSFCHLQAVTPIVSVLDYRVHQNCGITGDCNLFHIQGAINICGLGSYIYTGKRNTGCTLPVNWDISGGGTGSFTKDKLSDSTLKITFQQPGTYRLIGSLGDTCVADTVNIVVSGSAQSLDFGPADSTICPGNTIVLNAGTGFSSYRWQDGSNQPTYNVSAPGKYYVTAVSNCGTALSDTINFSIAAPVAISIGADRSKCNHDTLHLSAPPGFLNYSWGNNYNINTLTGQSVIVQPEVDTFYFIKAEKTPGCFAYDTVKITVNVSPPIYLGKDTSICADNFLTLSAGTGFNNYVWSNGMSTRQVAINTPGIFSVIGKTIEGCKSYDTLRLIEIHPLPAPFLDKNEGLCKGYNRILKAGKFDHYLWQDGSTDSTLVVQATGIYYVKVTDANGCKGSDTTNIYTIHELPANFLPASIEICNYGSKTIQPDHDFQKYEWSNGSSLKAIAVSNPGLYWLQVTDQHGCKAGDSILVNQKQCLVGLFVPSAFTPNNDSKNDVLKAMLFGNVQAFEFNVYNRYGQLIFTTKDPAKGWDGLVKGIRQETGTFVWICRYRLNDAPERVEKGSSILIR
jgi:gliding motility-associated-like protein